MKSQSRFALVASAIAAAIALATAAHAGDPLKCQQAIAKSFAKYVEAKTKALQKCNEGIVKGTPNTCPDATATDKIQKAETKLRSGIGKSCGGSTKSCTDGDAVALASIGWTMATCPNFEGGSCNNSIANCNDIADCLVCVGEAAVDQSIALSYGNLTAGEFGTGDPVNKCQLAIGKNAAKFISAKNKALAKCEAGVMKGTVTGPCPDAGKAQPAIAKAQTKMKAGICKSCGGADKLCDGNNDLTPSEIGFASNCASVTIPGGSSCAATISTLQDLVNCVTCVNEYKDDCLDPIAVPSVKPAYPPECAAGNEPPCAATPNGTATPCPTSTPGVMCPGHVVTEANGSGVDLDSGWTGQSHDAHAPDGSRLTLALNTCSHPDASTCGVCNTTGPVDNAGGTQFNNHRCLLDTSVVCTSDLNCAGISRQCINSNTCVGGTNNGAACSVSSECPGSGAACIPRTCTVDADCPGGSCSPSVCTYFFGSPLPLSSGGVTVCVTNQITAPVTGTVDVEGGTTATTIQLQSIVYSVGADLSRPCPTCDTLRCHGGLMDHICVGGTNDGAMCTASSECPSGNCVPKPCTTNADCPSGTCGLSCAGGPRDTLACTVNGTNSLYGSVSFDCPPSPAGDIGHLPIPLLYTTGSQSITLSMASPNCRQASHTGEKCFCDTCNNAAATPCTSNADCVAAGATVCGGKRCQVGSNAGAPCSVSSQCPGGGCGVPGQTTQPNACNDSTCSPTMSCLGGCNALLACTGAFKCVGGTNGGALCTVASECPGGRCNEQCPGGTCVSGNEGQCDAGPLEQFCAIETFRGCSSDAGCLKPGDHCTFKKLRKCFLDNGVPGGSVTVTGVPYPKCGDSGTGTIGALFCIPPTSADSVNAVSGLPGLGRVSLPYTATFLP